MSYRLSEHLRYCTVGGRAIFIDMRTARYFCLPRETDAIFREIVCKGECVESSVAVANELIGTGVLFADPGCPGIAPPVSMPVARLPLPVAKVTGVPGRRLWLSAMTAQFASHLELAIQPFFRVINRLEAQRRSFPDGGECSPQFSRYAAITYAFTRTNLFFRPFNRCLQRAIAYRDVAVRLNLCPMLVIGVRVNPFSAHAWIQAGDTIWLDDLEQASNYTPILVV